MTPALRVGAAIAALALSSAPISASADAVLRSDGARVFESSHTRTIDLGPLVADVRDEHVFGRRGSTESTQLFYELDLPRAATVTGFSVKLGRAVHRATAIDADAAVRMVPDADGGEADLGLLREITSEDTERTRYQLVIYPLDRGGATVEIRWSIPTKLEAGRVSMELPGRGSAGNLTPTRLIIKPRGEGPVSKLDTITIDGAAVRAGAVSSHPRATATIGARAVFSRVGAPVFRFEATSLGGDLSALTMTGIAPQTRVSDAHFERVLVLVDVSRSMGPGGVEAAALLAQAIARATPRDTPLEVILFDRKARGVFRKLARNSAGTPGAIATAIKKATPLANGTDLVAALSRAGQILRKKRRPDERGDAIVLISDGESSVALTAAKARLAAGDDLADHATFFAIELGVSSHPLSRRPGGPLRQLISSSGGRAWAIWAHRAAAEAPAIVRRIEPTAHTTGLVADVGGKPLERLRLPAHLGPGSGFVATTLWRGKPPRSVTIRSRRGGKPVRATVSRSRQATSGGDAHQLRRLGPTLISAVGSDRKEIARAGLEVGVVSSRYSLVIPDPSSRFARDRLAFARRWGSSLYRRAPTRFEVGTADFYKKLETLARPRVATAGQASGRLDRDTIGRAIRAQLFRPIRHCYERALRTSKKLDGVVSVRFEVSRSEVVRADIFEALGMPDALQRCMVDAAYRLKPPSVFGDSETTYLIRYSFRLKRSREGASVERGPEAPITTPVDTSDPLDGLD